MKYAKLADPRLHYETPLRQTPFHPRTSAANKLNMWGAWGGYTTALGFDDEAELRARSQVDLTNGDTTASHLENGSHCPVLLLHLQARHLADGR